MANDSCLPPNHYMIANFSTSAYARLCCDHGMMSYFYIVGNLYQVVQLCTGFNNCRTHCGTIDRGVSANFNMIFHNHISYLWYLFERSEEHTSELQSRVDLV